MITLSPDDFSTIKEMEQAFYRALETDDEVELDLSDGDKIVKMRLFKNPDGTVGMMAKTNQQEFVQDIEDFVVEQGHDARLVYKGNVSQPS